MSKKMTVKFNENTPPLDGSARNRRPGASYIPNGVNWAEPTLRPGLGNERKMYRLGKNLPRMPKGLPKG